MFDHMQKLEKVSVEATNMSKLDKVSVIDDSGLLAHIMQFPALMSAGNPLAEKIAYFVALPLHNLGYYLVRVHLDALPTLQIMVRRLDGKVLEVADCQKISHGISALLDVEDPIASRYHLEISSTGIDCPLSSHADFQAHLGDEIKVEMCELHAGFRKIRGILSDVKTDEIEIVKRKDNVKYCVPFREMKMAKLVLTDELLQKHVQ